MSFRFAGLPDNIPRSVDMSVRKTSDREELALLLQVLPKDYQFVEPDAALLQSLGKIPGKL